ERTGASLSLLLVELEDAERLLAIEPVDEARAVFGRVALAIEGTVGRGGLVGRERDGRAWVVAPGRGRLGAEELAARIDGAVRAAGEWRGAPLMVSVGIAVLGERAGDRAG